MKPELEPLYKTDRKTVLVLGSGRSGGTWLAGLLASPFRYRLLFEPFHPGHVPGAELVADRHYAPDDLSQEVIAFISRALTDRIDSEWIAQSSNRRFNMHRWRCWPKVRIVKCIRGNLLIPALRQMYGPDLPILVLMRHPGAVVQSMLRVKFPWAFDLATLLAQVNFAQTYQVPLDRLRGFTQDPVGQVTVRWLIENLYLFSRAEALGARLVFYEDLVEDPVGCITSLCAQLGLKVVDGLEEKVKRPSYTTHPRSAVRTGVISTQTWRERLPEESQQRIEQIMYAVGFSYPR